jgi:small subunit ribosomal protein S20
VKRATTTVGGDDNVEAGRVAVKRIDMAAAKGIIHRNAAARKKSRLMKKINAGV